MDPTQQIEPVAKVMYEYGGWGLSAILMLVIWRMAKYILDLHKEQKSEAKEQYKQLIETLISNKTAIDQLAKALQDFMSRMNS